MSIQCRNASQEGALSSAFRELLDLTEMRRLFVMANGALGTARPTTNNAPDLANTPQPLGLVFYIFQRKAHQVVVATQ